MPMPGLRLKLVHWQRSLITCGVAASLQIGTCQAPTQAAAAGSGTWSSVFAQGQDALANQDLPAAEAKFRQALALSEAVPDKPDHIDKSMMRLADTLLKRDKTAEAQRLYQQVLALRTKRFGSANKQLVPVLMTLGSIQEAAGDHTTAMQYYKRALRINEVSFGPYSPGVGASLRSLARATYKSGDKTTARQTYKRALAVLTQDPSLSSSNDLEKLVQEYADLISGNDNSNKDLITDFDKDILGQSPQPTPAARASGQPQSAWQKENKKLLGAVRQDETNEAPQVTARSFKHPSTDKTLTPAYDTVSASIFKQNRYGQGEAAYKKMIAADVDALGPNHPSVGNDLSGLGQLYLSQGRYGEAKPLFERATAIYEKAYGADNTLTVKARSALAAAEVHLGQPDRASDLYRAALGQGQWQGPNTLDVANSLNNLAYMYYQKGQLAEAATFYQWAVASTEGALGKQDPRLAACLKDYAQVLRGLGQTADAEATDARANAILSPTR